MLLKLVCFCFDLAAILVFLVFLVSCVPCWNSEAAEHKNWPNFETKREETERLRASIGSLRIDDFCTTTPLDCVTYLLRMPIWALAGVATKSTTLVRAICRRPGNSRTWGYFSKFSLDTSGVSARYFKYHLSDMFLTYVFDFVSVLFQVTTFYNRNLKGPKSCVSFFNSRVNS